jgi:mannosyltransferase OCH1-like enzyme
MNKYIIIIICIFIVILIFFRNDRENFYVSENNYVSNISRNNNIYLIDKSKMNININQNDILCIPQYKDNKSIKLFFLNFTNKNIMIDMKFDSIVKEIYIKSFYTDIIITDNSFNFVPKAYKNINIPKIIMQTSKNRRVSNNKFLSIRSIIDNNPNYNYEFYDNDEARKFIKKNFKNDVVNAYDRLIPGAYKADLFRYCYLYINGGIYVDCKMLCHINFDELFTFDYDIILVNDRIPNAYWNGFICAKPNLDIFKKCINQIVIYVNDEYYGKDALDITGPRLFYEMGSQSLFSLKYKLLYLTNIDYRDSNNYIYDENGKKLLNVMYPKYYDENDYQSKNHYSIYWKDRNVYKKN